MDRTTRASTLFLAVAVFIFGLVWLRDILSTFALAVFLWLIIDGFANAIDRRSKLIPYPAALAFALVVVFAGLTFVIAVVADAGAEFARNGAAYRVRIDEVIAQVHALVASGPAPTVGDLWAGIDPARLVGRIAQAAQGLASNALFVAIYVGFLFAAQASFPAKLDRIFPEPEARAQARRVIGGMRQSMERYLWVQTVMSVLTASLSYATLTVLGLDNALFWSFVIFLLNYIPTIGSIVATILPTVFALVQYDTLWQPLAVFAGVGLWQFSIGNFLQPRVQGENLNLSTIVVLLGLAVWGVIWGVPGMFLSSPLTVMVMIVLAQFSSTYWIAVLLSADGRPEVGVDSAARKTDD